MTYSAEGLREIESADLEAECNRGCGCSTDLYDPVCADGVEYFSPCYAGCGSGPVEDDNGDTVQPPSLLPLPFSSLSPLPLE